MRTIVDSNYVLAAGQSLIVTDDSALEVRVFSALPTPPSPSVTINGLLESHISAASFTSTEALRYTAPIRNAGLVQIGASGTVRAVIDNSATAQAFGVRVLSVVDLTNDGRIEVRTNDISVGIDNTYSDSRFVNHGVIEVRGASAYGIATTNGGTVVNTGMIDVAGVQSAVGVGVELLETATVDNSGSIRVRATAPTDLAIGVSLSGSGLFTNSGVVDAPRAIRLATGLQTSHIVNTGQLIGLVDLSLGVGDFKNSGSVLGAVSMGAGADRYDGRLGTVSGAVSGGGGSDSLVGGGGAETLSGEAGDDTVDGGSSGADRLDGGTGADLLSFGGSGVGIRLDVAAQSASNGASFTGFERYRGSDHGDTILGSAAMDTLTSGLGADTVNGGAGNDNLTDAGGVNYLRGDDGDDSIVGGVEFDDINGNMGNDTCVSGGGDDWVVGGKDNDSLVGSGGQNLVYGNIGNDTCDAGAGNDIVRGGQDNDVVNGGGGDDFVSGDRGDDTMTGGAGADLFHTFGEAGLDRVTDFNLAQGDRVMLDPGTQFTVSQTAADTVISMVGGGQMILVGVSMSALTPGWIFGA